MDPAPTINYCLRNVTPEARVSLRNSSHTVVEDFCLQRCGDCEQGPILVIDGELFAGPSHAALLAELDRRPGPSTSKGHPS